MPTPANPNVGRWDGVRRDPNAVGVVLEDDAIPGLPRPPIPSAGYGIDLLSRGEADLRPKPAGVPMRPLVQELRTTIRRWWAQAVDMNNGGEAVLLVEDDRTDLMVTPTIYSPQWTTPTPRRLEPTTWRGD